ncbi:hypothetical protein EES45_04365 [Streptomyces sp. ADI97-07]|nr:hypothetical protein EES45_04365 [Streptomyces sp. ADI97-07]GHA86539.1 hypothetical protein GCM10010392_10870 [Streptomyces clavifer]
MAVAPVSGAVGVTVEVQGSATGAAGPGSTTGVEWLVAPWQELPGPRSPGASALTTDSTAVGTGVKARTAGGAGVPPPDAAVAEGAQQKNTATRASSQPSTTAGVNPPRLRSVRSVRLVIAAIVR